MDVGQLILELAKHDPNLPVARDGCEGEHSGIHPIEFVRGVYCQFDTMDKDDKTNAVLLS